MKFTEEQKGLIALLPNNSKDYKLTDAARLVWGAIILLHGMDAAKDNGYVYRTNEAMMNDTGIKSENTVIAAVRNLELNGIIITKRGKRGEASEYILLEGGEVKNAVKKSLKNNDLEKIEVINCSNNRKNCSIINNGSANFDKKIEDMTQLINELSEKINTLLAENAELKIAVKNCSNKIEGIEQKISELQEIEVINCSIAEEKNCSTDTESEKEKETSITINDDSGNVNVTEEAIDNNNVIEEVMTSADATYDISDDVAEALSQPHFNDAKRAEVQQWFGNYLQRATTLMNSLYHSRDVDVMKYYIGELNNKFNKCESPEVWQILTTKQQLAHGKVIERYNGIMKAKREWMNNTPSAQREDDSVAGNNTLNREVENNNAAPAPAAPTAQDREIKKYIINRCLNAQVEDYMHDVNAYVYTVFNDTQKAFNTPCNYDAVRGLALDVTFNKNNYKKVAGEA